MEFRSLKRWSTLKFHCRQSIVLRLASWKFCACVKAFCGALFGSGQYATTFGAIGSNRLFGTTFPGNASRTWPVPFGLFRVVAGSYTGITAPATVNRLL